MEFSRMIMHLSMQRDLSNHGLMNTRMKFNIYFGLYSYLISI
ncbi:unnamed protein product [Larinioides sclopetarius]|uniref:Uncharacterized protein n=1 Tax=Larinioides sclopetarius TaxID=280406 RepID=A0AAV2AWF2_9ARAC